MAVAVALVIAVVCIRERRAPRYALIAAALVIGSSYSVCMAIGDRETDAVERFDLIEYGVIAWLFYRAWKPANDLSIVILPVLAGLIVGTCDEWLQWFIPNRVGEARDVALNFVAVGCGLLSVLGADPPASFRARCRPSGAIENQSTNHTDPRLTRGSIHGRGAVACEAEECVVGGWRLLGAVAGEPHPRDVLCARPRYAVVRFSHRPSMAR